MPLTVSPEIEAKAQQIPDLSARLERFIAEQFELEQWRARCAKPEVAEIVKDGLEAGNRLRASGMDRHAMFARLQALTEGLSHGE